MTKEVQPIGEVFKQLQNDPNKGAADQRRTNQHQERPRDVYVKTFPFANIPLPVITSGIKGNSIHVYAFLLAVSGPKGYSYYGRREMAKMLKKDAKTLKPCIDDLRDRKLIHTFTHNDRMYYVCPQIKLQVDGKYQYVYDEQLWLDFEKKGIPREQLKQIFMNCLSA